MSGETDLAQALADAKRSTGSGFPTIFDARVTECMTVYDQDAQVWTVVSVTVRPLNSTTNIDASWSSVWEMEVNAAAGADLTGALVEVRVIGNRPRVAYTVRG